MVFIGTPGFNYSISITTTAIDLTKQSNQEYMNSLNSSMIDFNLGINLRECMIGEYFTTTGQCIFCPALTSYSLTKMTEPGSCQKCPTSQAVCNGGSDIGPLPGYWRSTNLTSTFIRCLRPSACLGMVQPQFDPQGSCGEGY